MRAIYSAKEMTGILILIHIKLLVLECIWIWTQILFKHKWCAMLLCNNELNIAKWLISDDDFGMSEDLTLTKTAYSLFWF